MTTLTGLLSPAVHRLRAAGFEIDDTDVSHAGPTMSEHILVHGRYRYDLDRPPKELRPAPIPQHDSTRRLRRAEPDPESVP